MTLEELEKKLMELDELRTTLRAQIAELKAQNKEKPKPPRPRWKPNSGELYYYLTKGIVTSTLWDDDEIDRLSFNAGIVFMSKTAAEFALERLKVLAEMREWAGDWDDPYILYYDHISGYVGTIYTQNTNLNLTYGEMRYATKADAEECIKAVGEDRIKKYYFRIPEETEND